MQRDWHGVRILLSRPMAASNDRKECMMQNHGPAPEAAAIRKPPGKVPRGIPRQDDGRDLERDGWWRTMSATLAFIKWSQTRLEQAEQKLRDQELRIQELELQVTRDELTGLNNRRGFFDMFERELDRARRGHSGGGLLIMVDLDNFKVINETYGHQAGDAALRMVAKTLLGNSRTMDCCARLGGDEFVLLLVNSERDKALARAQNLIKQLNSLSLVWYGAELPIRASLGLKDYGAADDPDTIFGDADNRLSQTKRSSGWRPAAW